MSGQYLNLSVVPADAAFGLMADYDADPFPNKVSLIAGAYRDEHGRPWVLPSVRKVVADIDDCNILYEVLTAHVRLKPVSPVMKPMNIWA